MNGKADADGASGAPPPHVVTPHASTTRTPRAATLTVTLLVVALLGALATSCPGKPDEGATRPLRKAGSAGIFSCEGSEMYVDGDWLKQGPFIFRNPDTGEEVGRGAYEKDREQGAWTLVFDDGIIGEGSFEAGERHGPWKNLYPSGAVESEGSYQNGKREGTWSTYRRDGSVALEVDYDAGERKAKRDYPAKSTR